MSDIRTMIKFFILALMTIIGAVFSVNKVSALDNVVPTGEDNKVQNVENKNERLNKIMIVVNNNEFEFIPANVKSLVRIDEFTWQYPYPACKEVIKNSVNELSNQLGKDTRLTDRGIVLLTLALRDGLLVKVELPTETRILLGKASMPMGNDNGSKNALLTAKAINGTVLKPGEVFSFNRVVGERSTSRGYLESISISGNQRVPDIGGGVCRTATLLHHAAMNAGMEILERHSHTMEVTYAAPGDDAAVSWPNVDYRFKNTSNKSVSMCFNYSNNICKCQIWTVIK